MADELKPEDEREDDVEDENELAFRIVRDATGSGDDDDDDDDEDEDEDDERA